MNLHIVIHQKNKQQAVAMAKLAASNGVSRLLLISHHGDDHLLPETVRQIKAELPDVKVGINCLNSSFLQTFAFAEKAGADAVWFDDAGFHSSQPDPSKKEMFMLALSTFRVASPDVDVFVGVGFKYQRPDPQPGLAALDVIAAGCIPTTSGPATGLAAQPEFIATLCRELPKSNRLALASGVSAENIGQWSGVSDVFVASSVSDDEYTLNAEKVFRLSALCEKMSAE